MGEDRVIKRVKLSDRKFSLIVRCFAADITAVSCADIVNTNRKTADKYYHNFRELILREQEKERVKFLAENETEIDESYFGPSRVRGKRGRGAGKKIAVVGLLQRAGKVFTKPVDRCSKEELLPVIKAKVKAGVDVITDGWPSYDGLAVYGFNHKKIKHGEDEFSDGNGKHINGIESFWSFAKRRLAKFNGIRRGFFGKYLKETEWRFNNHDKIQTELRRLIREDRRK